LDWPAGWMLLDDLPGGVGNEHAHADPATRRDADRGQLERSFDNRPDRCPRSIAVGKELEPARRLRTNEKRQTKPAACQPLRQRGTVNP